MPRARAVSLLATATLSCMAATTLSAPLVASAATIPAPGKSTDWTLKAGHQLVVGVGTNTGFSWSERPSNEKITVTGSSIALALQNTNGDVRTQGDRSPYLTPYLNYYTSSWDAASPGTFNINVPQG